MNKLKIISGFLYFAKWTTVAIALVASAMILSMDDKTITISSPTLNIADDELQNSLDEAINSFEEITLTVKGISAEVPSTWPLQILSVLTLILKFGYLLWILQIIINIIHDVQRNEAFRPVNITRLKRAAWLLILSPFFLSILKGLNLMAISHTHKLPDEITYSWVDEIHFDFFTIGFLLYAIAVAFGEGLKMKQENELTI